MRMEHWWFTVRLRLRSILRGRRVERVLEEELQFHLEHKIEEGIANGLSPKEARYAAMDGLEQRKEEMRDMRRIHWLTDFLDDAHYAIRSLRRTSGLTAFVVIIVPSLFLVTMLAAYVPARRASRIAPTQALRYE
jgi:macrolide transport system ATP-binding/permease protein